MTLALLTLPRHLRMLQDADWKRQSETRLQPWEKTQVSDHEKTAAAAISQLTKLDKRLPR